MLLLLLLLLLLFCFAGSEIRIGATNTNTVAKKPPKNQARHTGHGTMRRAQPPRKKKKEKAGGEKTAVNVDRIRIVQRRVPWVRPRDWQRGRFAERLGELAALAGMDASNSAARPVTTGGQQGDKRLGCVRL